MGSTVTTPKAVKLNLEDVVTCKVHTGSKW